MRTIVILISGRGSNMQAIVEAASEQKWPARIAAVISNKADAPGLVFAEKRGISTAVVNSEHYSSRESFDRVLQQEIDQHCPDLVILAGFMRILSAEFVAHFAGRLLNIHPSLLPSFPGLATHQQALAAGVKLHGATVHYVSAELDYGPIVAQVAVPVFDDDSQESLAQRVLEQEHILYPRAVKWFINGQLTLEDGRVIINSNPQQQTQQ